MKEFFQSDNGNLFLIISFSFLFLVALFGGNKKRSDLTKGLENLFIKAYVGLDHIFRIFIMEQILNQYILFPLTIILSLYLYFRYNLKASELILFITFMAILWYSKETFQLKNEQRSANKIFRKSQRPCLTPFIRHIDENHYRLKIKNTGRGVAIDVLVKIITSGNSYAVKLRNNIRYISSGEEQSIKFPDNDSHNFCKTDLFKKPEGFRIAIECRDIIDHHLSSFEYGVRPEGKKNWEIQSKKINLN